MAALEARSLLTRETVPSPDALYPLGVGGIVRTVGGLRSERWAPSPQNSGRLEIGMGGRDALESAGFTTLDRLLKRLHANKTELLMVLDHPEIPLLVSTVTQEMLQAWSSTRKSAKAAVIAPA
jgi:hypothetical protein